MTVILNKPSDFDPARWSAMPGWSITVDLTPPELRARRALAALRRIIALALALVVLLCIGGYLLAAHANSAAQDDLDAASSNTTRIQATIGQQSTVTRVKSATSAIETQLATLFAQDVDIPKLIASIPSPARNHLTVTAVNVTLAGVTASTTPGVSATIGTVTMSGIGQRLTDLAAEVQALAAVRGVTNVIPTTNSANASGTTWSLTFELTSELYTHRFATGGK